MSKKQSSQQQLEKSYVNIGLMLTGQVFYLKTKLKQINPTLIYQWQGDNVNGQMSGKGCLRVRNSLTNELVYQCEVKQSANGVPDGKIKFTKINYFTSSQLVEYKVKQIQSYQGLSKNLKKHGKGIYKFQEFYSTGKIKNMSVSGQWDNDILILGVYQNQYGKKQLNLTKNLQWSKSVHSIMIGSEDKINSVEQIINKNKNKLIENNEKPKSKVFKQNQSNQTLDSNPQKYLDPLRIR